MLLAFWPAFGPRRALAALAGGAALCLPWYLWDPPRFTRRTVDFFLDLPARPGLSAACLPTTADHPREPAE